MPYNNGTPLISVLVAVYNVEQYLKQCIDSILNQTYKNLEIILVDDCSTDKSGQICDNYAKKDSRVKVIHHKKNECLSGVRNTGITNATGELVSFIDADDYIDPDFYDYLLSIMKRNDMKPDIAYCSFRKVDDNGQFISQPKNSNPDHIELFNSKEATINCLRARKGFQMYVWNGLFKREVLPFFEAGRRIGQDQDFTIHTLLQAKLIAKGYGVKQSYRIRLGGSKSLNLEERAKFQYLALDDIKKHIVNAGGDADLVDAYYERCFRADLGLMDRYSTRKKKNKPFFKQIRNKLRNDARKTYKGLTGIILYYILSVGETPYRIAFYFVKKFQK